jgi:hypothetical protein
MVIRVLVPIRYGVVQSQPDDHSRLPCRQLDGERGYNVSEATTVARDSNLEFYSCSFDMNGVSLLFESIHERTTLCIEAAFSHS